MVGYVEICLVFLCLNMREGFNWTRAKVKQPLKGFSFWFVCFVCVLLFYFWVLLLLSGGLASFCALTINF